VLSCGDRTAGGRGVHGDLAGHLRRTAIWWAASSVRGRNGAATDEQHSDRAAVSPGQWPTEVLRWLLFGGSRCVGEDGRAGRWPVVKRRSRGRSGDGSSLDARAVALRGALLGAGRERRDGRRSTRRGRVAGRAVWESILGAALLSGTAGVIIAVECWVRSTQRRRGPAVGRAGRCPVMAVVVAEG